ncbi:MAG: NAD(+) synthase [Dehalococcoidia bacterium]|nr:NAD(+) synthase [Dehalococcoidia bacterium]
MTIIKITNWIKKYAIENNRASLVVGISGGIDSSVVSTLCAKTGIKVYAISMPIDQISSQHDLSLAHGNWLTSKFSNVNHKIIDLSEVYRTFNNLMTREYDSEHSFANSKSRLRMVALHQISGSKSGLVVGTGNKVEDFGVGFFTKYGDGGVDISPIADLMKTEVWEIGKKLGILQEIIDAPPTDGLWEDGRTDYDQLKGLTYQELEDAMKNSKSKNIEKYNEIRKPNIHKMKPIPVFKNNKR